MASIKIVSPINRKLTSGIKFRVKDTKRISYYNNDPSDVLQTYQFHALEPENADDVVMHLDLRNEANSINPPAADYSDYYLYSSANAVPGIPITIEQGEEAGDSIYNGMWDNMTIKKQNIIDFGNIIGNGFTLSMWIKISHNNPNSDWYRTTSEGGAGSSDTKTLRSDIVGSFSTSNNMSFGIMLNKGRGNDKDLDNKGNTLFSIRSEDQKYTAGYITNKIMTDEWINLAWVGKIDPEQDKMIFEIYVNGQKAQYYPILEEINSTSTWAPLDNGLGFGLWSSTDSDTDSEFVSIAEYLGGSRPNLNSNSTNSHGRFQLSTFTLYKKALSASQVFGDYRYHKERYLSNNRSILGTPHIATNNPDSSNLFLVGDTATIVNSFYDESGTDKSTFTYKWYYADEDEPFAYGKSHTLTSENFNRFIYATIEYINDSKYEKSISTPQYFIEQKGLVIQNNLVAHLDAGDMASYPGTGTTWYDLSGNGNDAQIVNTPTYTQETGGEFTNFSSGYAKIPYNSSIQPEQITMEVWAYRDSWNATSGFMSLLSNYEYGGFRIVYDDKLIARIAYGTSDQTYYSVETTNVEPGWHHIVSTYDKKNLNLYIDGVLFATTDNWQENDLFYGGYENDIIIGGEMGVNNLPSSGLFFDGKISSVSVYNRALTSYEVMHNFKAKRDRIPHTGELYIAGVPQAQSTLTIGNTIQDFSVTDPVFAYEWFEAETDLSLQVGGEEYLVKDSDVGKNIYVVASYVNESGNTETVTAASVKIQDGEGIITEGLVLHLDAGNADSYSGDGTTWYDLSGNENNAQLIGSVTYTNNIGGGELSNFYNSSNYARIPYTNILAPTKITISIWAYYETNWSNLIATGYGKIISKTQSGGYTVDADGDRIAFTANNGAYSFTTAPPPSSAGWHNIACVYDGNFQKIYIDGTEVASSAVSGDLFYRYNNAMIIGGEAGSGNTAASNQGFEGNISSITIYNRGLNNTEINYNFVKERDRFPL